MDNRSSIWVLVAVFCAGAMAGWYRQPPAHPKAPPAPPPAAPGVPPPASRPHPPDLPQALCEETQELWRAYRKAHWAEYACQQPRNAMAWGGGPQYQRLQAAQSAAKARWDDVRSGARSLAAAYPQIPEVPGLMDEVLQMCDRMDALAGAWDRFGALVQYCRPEDLRGPTYVRGQAQALLEATRQAEQDVNKAGQVEDHLNGFAQRCEARSVQRGNKRTPPFF